MANPTAAITLPVLKGKKAVVSYKLIPSDKRGLYRVMVGDRWYDKNKRVRTLAECIALVHESAALALGHEVAAAPSWPRGAAVRVVMPGHLPKDGSEPLTTRTRLACEPYERNGAYFVRVVGSLSEISCNDVEVL
jgi:hypothetical protein